MAQSVEGAKEAALHSRHLKKLEDLDHLYRKERETKKTEGQNRVLKHVAINSKPQEVSFYDSTT